jgi:hypothetical protein
MPNELTSQLVAARNFLKSSASEFQSARSISGLSDALALLHCHRHEPSNNLAILLQARNGEIERLLRKPSTNPSSARSLGRASAREGWSVSVRK